MGKPGVKTLLRFKEQFDNASRRLGKKQFLTYYFIAAHPGCTEKDMHELRRFATQNLKLSPEQVQIFTPGSSRIFRRSPSCGPWSGLSAGQQEGKRQSRSGHAPAVFLRGQSKPYILAVGPPTSAMMPRNFGCFVKRATSSTIERELRLTTWRPWWTVMAQNRQLP